MNFEHLWQEAQKTIAIIEQRNALLKTELTATQKELRQTRRHLSPPLEDEGDWPHPTPYQRLDKLSLRLHQLETDIEALKKIIGEL